MIQNVIVNCITEQQASISQKIMYSEEAHFETGKYVNKQNLKR